MRNKMALHEPDIGALLKYANGIIATLREPFLVLDKNLKVISANKSFFTIFKVTGKETIGRPLYDLGNKQWKIPKLLKLLEEIVPDKKIVKDYEVAHDFEQIGARVMILNACKLRVPDDTAAIISSKVKGNISEGDLILLAIEDVTERKRLQEELKESEARYRRAFETSRDGLLLVHKTEGSILNSNESAQELLRYSHAELLKKKLWGICAVKDREDFLKTMSRLEKDGVVHYEDISVKTKEGLSIDSEVILVNKAKVMQCNIRNITERKRIEGELTLAKEREYRTLIESLPGKVFLKDKDSVYKFCNEEYAKDLKIKADEIAGRTDYEFFPTHLAEKYRADDKRIVQSGETENFEEEYMVIGDYLDKAKKIIINTVKVPVKNKVGNVTGILGFFWDITERKNAEEELRKNRKLLLEMTSQIPGVVYQFYARPNGKMGVYYVSSMAEQILGIKPGPDLEGFFERFSELVVPEYRESFFKSIDKAVSEVNEWKYDGVLQKPSGEKIWFSGNATPIRRDDEIIFNGMIFDITERKKAEELLRESELKFKAIVEGSNDGIIFCDTETQEIVYSNDAMARLLGHSKEDIINMTIQNLHREDDWGSVKLEFLRHVTGETSLSSNIPVVRKDGSIFFADVASVNLIMDNRRYFVAFFRDVTERNKAAEEIRLNQEKIRVIFDQTFQFIGMMTVDGKLIEANRTAMEFAGIEKSDCIGKFFWDTPWWTHSKKMQDNLREAVIKAANGETVFFEATHPAADGCIHYVDFSLKPIRDQNGKVVFLIPEGRDITDRKKVENEREMTLKWQEDVNALRQSLLVPSPLEHKLKVITDSAVRIFNADFCRIWLTRPGDLCDKGCVHAKVTDGPHVCRFRNKCLHLVASSGRYTHIDGKGHARVPFGCYKIGLVASGEEHKFLTNDVPNDPRVHDHEWARELGLVSFAGYQLKNTSGDTFGVMALFAKHPILPAEDAMLYSLSVTISFVVQQAAAAEEIIREQAMKSSLEIKTSFTGMVSHELRTPLAAIKEGVSVVLDKVTGDINIEQNKYLSIVKNNVDRLDRLISEVLDFQKLESGKMELKAEDSDLNEVVKGMCDTMALLFKKKHLALKLDLCDDLPKVKFDRDKISQVLTNLVNNALKFTEKGSVTVRTSKGDNFIQVMVKDTGVGIKKGDIQRLFREFTQLQRKVGGAGLGLSICKRLIEAHRGKIWAESEFGKGASFYFNIPIKERRE
ncbi:MAG: PAS domain S-box protein [Candidatus Omnitrophica bacterium]|nr:PAS domain S-box protein [Candidatus Omnitrophota bacterium]